MDVRPLTLADRGPWARLLAVCFDRSPEQMEQMLTWFHDGFPLVAMGAWDDERLVAQYCCRILELRLPGESEPVLAGMGLDMAVDPAYRGRGLLETVATPVHEAIARRGCIAGVGFSSAGGLAVTRASASYGYRVLGPMVSLAAPVLPRRRAEALELCGSWPEGRWQVAEGDDGLIHYRATPESLCHRFAGHPFRRYRFGVRRSGDAITGLVVYRHGSLRGLPGASLLAAFGEDRAGLLAAWAGAIRREGLHVAHLVASPASPMRDALATIGPAVRVPVSRKPYYLITRALAPSTPDVLFDLLRWDCTGGDVL
jgi:hypothetical protein